MADRGLTLLALHFHTHGDVDVGGVGSGADEEPELRTDGGSGVGKTIPAVAAVLAAAVLAVGVAWWHLRRSVPR